jgi:hypothetical protein
MNRSLNVFHAKDVDPKQVKKAIAPIAPPDKTKVRVEKGLTWIVPIMLAFLPGVSFLSQLGFSCLVGTQHAFYHHPTVMIVDWVLVPFNFLVVRVIEWRNGGRLYLIACFSVMLNVLTHAIWQYNGNDAGHMITKAGVFLPAGWVHLVFSTLETSLLASFIFCRKSDAPNLKVTTVFATTYFLSMGICGYLMHHTFIASDIIVLTSGIFFTLVYPQLDGFRLKLRRTTSQRRL